MLHMTENKCIPPIWMSENVPQWTRPQIQFFPNPQTSGRAQAYPVHILGDHMAAKRKVGAC